MTFRKTKGRKREKKTTINKDGQSPTRNNRPICTKNDKPSFHICISNNKKVSGDNSCCIKSFVNAPSATRAGTRYSDQRLVNSKSRLLPLKKDTYVFGSIIFDALSTANFPNQARTISRKVKVLCWCETCTGTSNNALRKSIKNGSGVVCIQLKKYSKHQNQYKTTASQTDMLVIGEKSKIPVHCNFRKLIGVKKSMAETLKEIATQCSKDMTLKGFGSHKRKGKLQAKRKKVFCEKADHHIAKNSLNQAKRLRRKIRSKSLLKYVLKREAIKSLQIKNNNYSLANNLKNFRLKMKHLLHLQKRIRASSKIKIPHFENYIGRIFKLKKHRLKNYKLLPLSVHKNKTYLKKQTLSCKESIRCKEKTVSAIKTSADNKSIFTIKIFS